MEDNEIDEDNIIVKMRMKYVKDLEDILECPICLDLPDGNVLTCVKGHHVCEKCQIESRREGCPTCTSNFNGSRNYLAEKLADKFEDIKISLLEPNHCSNRKIISKSVEIQTVHKKFVSKETQTVSQATNESTQTNFSETSIECQTDFYGDDAQTQTEFGNIDIIQSSATEESSCFEDASSDEEESNLVKYTDKNVLVSKLPLITCFIKNCNNKYGVDKIINHIKSNHRENMEEPIQFERHVINDKYQTNWTYNYEANKSYDHAINIFEMGLIFFNILIDEDGNVHGNIRVAKSYCNHEDIYYLVLIGNDDILLSEIFKGILPSCAYNSAKNNNIYIDKSIFSDYILDENQAFQCSLTLYKPEI